MGAHLQSIRCSHVVSIDVEEVINKDLDPWLRQHGCTLVEYLLLFFSYMTTMVNLSFGKDLIMPI